MRITGVFLAVVLSAAPVFGRQKPEAGVTAPKKGDIVTIRGCVAWPLLVQQGFTKLDITQKAGTAFTYRLSGDKNLVKPLQKEHSHTIVEVTGVLKSTGNPPPAPRGKDYKDGKTKVYVGVSGEGPPRPDQVDAPLLLRVTAFEATHARCNPAP
jgi:hypothetical protein